MVFSRVHGRMDWKRDVTIQGDYINNIIYISNIHFFQKYQKFLTIFLIDDVLHHVNESDVWRNIYYPYNFSYVFSRYGFLIFKQ